MTSVNLYYTGGNSIKVIGPVTGKIYVIPMGNAVPVDVKDAKELLKLTKTVTACCGGGKKTSNLYVQA